MKITIGRLCLMLLLLLLPARALWAKAAGNMLAQYLAEPRLAAEKTVLALVEITEVSVDRKPEGHWWKTGTLTLRPIESLGGTLPQGLRVRFYQRLERGDEWTWDGVKLARGRRLLGFFNHWSGPWEVTRDGATGVIQNVENIRPATLRRVQRQFKTPLLPPPPKSHATTPGKQPPPTPKQH
ncbi:MAG: hypothetical protein M3Y28_08780 [Armatimonadota bacterium]|nr:hypothetical protein [Armatimonadota bacterium]